MGRNGAGHTETALTTTILRRSRRRSPAIARPRPLIPYHASRRPAPSCRPSPDHPPPPAPDRRAVSTEGWARARVPAAASGARWRPNSPRACARVARSGGRPGGGEQAGSQPVCAGLHRHLRFGVELPRSRRGSSCALRSRGGRAARGARVMSAAAPTAIEDNLTTPSGAVAVALDATWIAPRPPHGPVRGARPSRRELRTFVARRPSHGHVACRGPGEPGVQGCRRRVGPALPTLNPSRPVRAARAGLLTVTTD